MEQEQMDQLPVQAQVDIWRQKSIAGTLTDDELRRAVNVIREGRIAAAALGASKKAAKGPTRSAEELLKGFMGGMPEADAEE